MQSNYLITATKCPECKKCAVFPYTFITKVNNETHGIISVKCDECGWKEKEVVAVKKHKEWLRDNE